jgi:hypothetical protein
VRVSVTLFLGLIAGIAGANDARDLILTSVKRHAPAPYVYEEQTLVLSGPGRRYSVRTLKHYVRRDSSGTKNLLVVTTPVDAYGMSLFVERDPGGVGRRGAKPSSSVLGSDFVVSDLEDEQTDEFHYEMMPDQNVEQLRHFVIRAVPVDNARMTMTGATERLIFLREDNLFVSRIDYHDAQGKLARRQSFRDPIVDDSGTWRANMILMENFRDGQRTLLKVDRRVHSPDYVPLSVFAGLS